MRSTAQLYDAFVEEMTAGGLTSFFREYAVVARLVGTLIDDWVENTAAFLERLDADRADLIETFGVGNLAARSSRSSPAFPTRTKAAARSSRSPSKLVGS